MHTALFLAAESCSFPNATDTAPSHVAALRAKSKQCNPQSTGSFRAQCIRPQRSCRVQGAPRVNKASNEPILSVHFCRHRVGYPQVHFTWQESRQMLSQHKTSWITRHAACCFPTPTSRDVCILRLWLPRETATHEAPRGLADGDHQQKNMAI